ATSPLDGSLTGWDGSDLSCSTPSARPCSFPFMRQPALLGPSCCWERWWPSLAPDSLPDQESLAARSSRPECAPAAWDLPTTAPVQLARLRLTPLARLAITRGWAGPF